MIATKICGITNDFDAKLAISLGVIAEKIIVTGIKNSIMEIFGFIRPNVDNTIEEECPIVNKVTIQNNFLK